MLIALITHHPEALGAIVRGTPGWVWALAAGLLAVGASQLRDRRASLARVTVMPVAIAGFSAWGTASAFGASSVLPQLMAVWLAATVAVALLVRLGRTDARYDAATRTVHLPGSVVPLLLIAKVFLLKWGVGVELAMDPQRVADAGFALSVAAAYGVASGIFLGRAARLWALAWNQRAAAAA